jgi:hypothetical protein
MYVSELGAKEAVGAYVRKEPDVAISVTVIAPQGEGVVLVGKNIWPTGTNSETVPAPLYGSMCNGYQFVHVS